MQTLIVETETVFRVQSKFTLVNTKKWKYIVHNRITVKRIV